MLPLYFILESPNNFFDIGNRASLKASFPFLPVARTAKNDVLPAFFTTPDLLPLEYSVVIH